ncbi:ferric-dicitrate binding protein FerR (iron transport regulator) [Pedobacter cryoconitis]|uniref:Ferric-dicitrate binding protein FerR (Iron transport regulator) n=1 Tax=Pedobacter cryoconitis TaxID=188932 RepID=A0A7W8ZR08_9SPHI|nr:FecR family protein [Pedobacter cryoconitis]MBB5638628.1 ferric-dicitrate binding protein FerR (iron transport regulator) [Pedobacter cryoconitis]MBB6274359.1 ferric-dicitrate binding protein FerR (iron transport regulator) [Pedobacter cryoconitis]
MKKDVKEVLDKISSGNYSPEEEAMAKLWLHQLHQYDEAGLSEKELNEASDQMWLSLQQHKKQHWLKRYQTSGVYLAAAASIAVIVGIGLYLNQPESLPKSTPFKAYANDIPAGSNKAYLTLANGKKLVLTNLTNGTMLQEAGVKITKTADGQLVYTAVDQGSKASTQYNSIETPRGGQYQLNLPDGTRVWINSASSLKYPASFASLKERKVELSGEAYFEVAKDKKHPFIVKSGKQEIQVLGTHFDVDAYPDEHTIKTTLLEGSVKLNKQVILKPGEQAELRGEKFNVSEVNVNDAIDWKNGEFAFTNEPLASILKKVSRWYDVDIVYTYAPLKMPTFTGSVSRSENISAVLKMLEETSNVRFSIEGRRISVLTK